MSTEEQPGGVVGDGGGGASTGKSGTTTTTAAERRRLNHLAYVTSGCGKDKEKDRVISTFWDVVWPKLDKHGWKKTDGQGEESGLTFFIPKGVEEGQGTRGRDYYDRIKDVLDRLREKRTVTEGGLIEDFDAECYRREEAANRSSRKRKKPPSGDDAKSNAKAATITDTWKQGRKFTKKSSRVGASYQPSSIPTVGEKTTDSGDLTMLWKPEAAMEAGLSLEKMEGMLQGVSSNKRADVLFKLAEQGYKVDDGFQSLVDSIPSTDGSDWDESRKKQFCQEVFKNHKDLSLVCKNMGIDMKTCLVYYYREFKNSTEYRLMKTVFDDDQYEKTARFERVYDVCAICGEGGELLICDECEGEYHLKCLRPPLRTVPEGRWECDECTDRKVLKLRNFLLGQTELRDTSAPDESEETKEELNLNAEALDVVRQFGKKVSGLLTPIEIEGEVEVTAEEVETTEKVSNSDPPRANDEMEVETEVKAEEVKMESESEIKVDDNVESAKPAEAVADMTTDEKSSGAEGNGSTKHDDGSRVLMV